MLPTKITADQSDDYRAKWQIVKLDDFINPFPNAFIVCADCDTGVGLVRLPPKPDGSAGDQKEFVYGPDSIKIIPKAGI